jgi:hypothetical protein
MFDSHMRKLYRRFFALGVLLCALALLAPPRGARAESCNTCIWEREICYWGCPDDDWRFGYICGNGCEEQYFNCQMSCTDCSECGSNYESCLNVCVTQGDSCRSGCAPNDTACYDACNSTESSCEQSCQSAHTSCMQPCLGG